MEQKYLLGIFALAMVSILGLGIVSAISFQNRVSDEEREALETAMEVGDYDSWAEIKSAQISEDKFNQARARHQERAEFRNLMREAREAGDWEAMQELKEQYGVGSGAHKRNANLTPCNM